MAQRGAKKKYTTAEAKAEAGRDSRNSWWGQNNAQVNSKRRQEYARKKEEAGRAVRKYTHQKKASRSINTSVKKLEKAVESPDARACRTANLTLSRARTVRNEMEAQFNGAKEAYFIQCCEEYINCSDASRGNENIERICSKFGAFVDRICQFEHQILNSVGSWAPQMNEYQRLKTDVQEAASMIKEIYEIALEGGKEEVLFRVTHASFKFQVG
ncbi:hypothetical protein BKA70DRAFT_1221575 [Coprinopsis sp. MPI-PUGE-AT-0042]|nr:hypothetical protein BKA70DRAFT_1221575 [Coprinopsis sp. MPI-PUGE-AT-0042]